MAPVTIVNHTEIYLVTVLYFGYLAIFGVLTVTELLINVHKSMIKVEKSTRSFVLVFWIFVAVLTGCVTVSMVSEVSATPHELPNCRMSEGFADAIKQRRIVKPPKLLRNANCANKR